MVILRSEWLNDLIFRRELNVCAFSWLLLNLFYFIEKVRQNGKKLLTVGREFFLQNTVLPFRKGRPAFLSNWLSLMLSLVLIFRTALTYLIFIASLWIKRFILINGGNIWVYSNFHKFKVFIFTLTVSLVLPPNLKLGAFSIFIVRSFILRICSVKSFDFMINFGFELVNQGNL